MIQIDDEILTELSDAVRAIFPDIFITSTLVPAPSSFPCLSFVEQNNATLRRTQTQDVRENHATIMYQIDVFSNKKSGKRGECKKIFEVADIAMQDLGFTRLFLNPVPNLEDASIYRMTGRYQAVVGKDKMIYRG